MLTTAAKSTTEQAKFKIHNEFCARLLKIPGPKVKLVHPPDNSAPPLSFRFINESTLGKGVEPTDKNFVIGCGFGKGPYKCRPHMGQNIGCEYSRLCECLEFASIDEKRLTAEEKELHRRKELDPIGAPKRFPYFQADAKVHPECLQPFYLASRNPIYECNPSCMCGPNCKTRVVQKGRKVPLEIFKTKDRGWGIRSTVDLVQGQFIDTYRGEIITNEEADRREEKAPEGKGLSYLYTLDKHVGDMGLRTEDCYVVDGEYMGGPTRFMNHSCEPNCRQYTVSYNKYDIKKYELVFFAFMPIRAGTELTFDYLDKDDIEDDGNKTIESSQDRKTMKCYCGSRRCRGQLWI